MTQANDQPQPASAAPVEQELGLAAERDAVLRQLDDRTNQTWAAKRERWAALVRAQDAEIDRLHETLKRQDAAHHVEVHEQVAAERERCLADCDAVGGLGAALVAQRIKDRA